MFRDSCRPPQSMRKLFKSSLGILPEGVTAYWKPRCGQVSREDQSKPWARQRRKDLKLCQPHEGKVTGSLRMAPVAPRRCHLSREKTIDISLHSSYYGLDSMNFIVTDSSYTKSYLLKISYKLDLNSIWYSHLSEAENIVWSLMGCQTLQWFSQSSRLKLKQTQNSLCCPLSFSWAGSQLMAQHQQEVRPLLVSICLSLLKCACVLILLAG